MDGVLDCLELCLDSPDCSVFSHSLSNGDCSLLRECTEFDEQDSDHVTGSRYCDPGDFSQGTTTDASTSTLSMTSAKTTSDIQGTSSDVPTTTPNVPGTTSDIQVTETTTLPEEETTTGSTDGTTFVTASSWFTDITDSSTTIQSIESKMCVVVGFKHSRAAVFTDPGYIMIVSGYAFIDITSDVEIVSLDGRPDCAKPEDFPVGIRDMVGTFVGGEPLVCGGRNSAGDSYSTCYGYSFESQTWLVKDFEVSELCMLSGGNYPILFQDVHFTLFCLFLSPLLRPLHGFGRLRVPVLHRGSLRLRGRVLPRPQHPG